ncbi:MAG: tRNA uridine-5-carboxymethylaminomethyl(34) synthesis GTPase MnmE [Mucispirillum sp.]|nr:tRNA uridine-5-carboxymethylaminomethyl(34) synthesis GTPase MnmE [Mucispirillum sp.]
MDTDTIAAPITALAVSPVITVRVSGKGAAKVFSVMDKNGVSGVIPQPNIVSRYVFNISEDNIHDDVLAVYFKAPRSFTGEDTVEISFHGNPIIVKSALNSIYSLGIRPALGGEFSKRAFMNGKIDLTQAESIQELISAKSLEGVNSAYNQLAGGLRKELDALKDKLLNMKAVMEAKIDFPDEDTVDEEIPVLKKSCRECSAKCGRLISSYSSYRNANKGVDLVIAGKPNVGKSSLMNTLLKEERSIVSSIPGTTRDFIKENLYIGSIPVHITDTAGIRGDVSGDIERLGIELSEEKIKSADIVLVLLDISSPLSIEDKKILAMTDGLCRIVAGNKIDISDTPSFDADIYISAKEGVNMDALIDILKEKTAMKDSELISGAAAITERHRFNLVKIEELLLKIEREIEKYPLDMMAMDLETCIKLLEEITGETYTEEVLDIVFSTFCIGK